MHTPKRGRGRPRKDAPPYNPPPKTKINRLKPESSDVRGLCVSCGWRPQASKGNGLFRANCQACHDATIYAVAERAGRGQSRSNQRRGYRAFKKSYCEECDFIAEHPCQLDVDHLDGNHLNNDPENLKTLCANCHRLKTQRNKDWAKLNFKINSTSNSDSQIHPEALEAPEKLTIPTPVLGPSLL